MMEKEEFRNSALFQNTGELDKASRGTDPGGGGEGSDSLWNYGIVLLSLLLFFIKEGFGIGTIQAGAWQKWYVYNRTLSFTIRTVPLFNFPALQTSSLFSDLELWSPLCEPPDLFSITSVMWPVFLSYSPCSGSCFLQLLPMSDMRSLISGLSVYGCFHTNALHWDASHSSSYAWLMRYILPWESPVVSLCALNGIQPSELGIQGPWHSRLHLYTHSVSVLLCICTTV